MAALFGLLFLALGLIFVFAKGLAWRLVKISDWLEGEPSRKGSEWPLVSTVTGVVFVGLGLLLIYLSMKIPS